MAADSDRPPPAPAVAPAGEGRARVFPCEQCGADLSFDIDAQSLACPYCGHVVELAHREGGVAERDLKAALERLAEQRGGKSQSDAKPTTVREVKCQACGAHVQFQGAITGDVCPWCGAPLQIAGAQRAENRVPTDAVLAFEVDEPRARGVLRSWVQSRWLAPNDFGGQGAQERMRGVYLPFWTYDAMASVRYAGERGDHYWVTVRSGNQTQRVMRTRWSYASGAFRRFFDDVLICATTGLPIVLLDRLEPWPLQRLRPFAEDVLAGFATRTYELALPDGFMQAKHRMDAAIRREVEGRIGGDEQRVDRVDTDYRALTYKLVLLPVWLLAYRYRGKTYRVTVNATTGEVQGERPWSVWKIALLVVFVVASIVAAIWSGRGYG